MIARVGEPLTFYGFFTSGKLGATGLTVTASGTKPDGGMLVLGEVSEVGNGVYSVQAQAHHVDQAGQYLVLFETEDITVDVRQIPAIWDVKAESYFFSGGSVAAATRKHRDMVGWMDQHPAVLVVDLESEAPSATGRPDGMMLIAHASRRVYYSRNGLWVAGSAEGGGGEGGMYDLEIKNAVEALAEIISQDGKLATSDRNSVEIRAALEALQTAAEGALTVNSAAILAEVEKLTALIGLDGNLATIDANSDAIQQSLGSIQSTLAGTLSVTESNSASILAKLEEIRAATEDGKNTIVATGTITVAEGQTVGIATLAIPEVLSPDGKYTVHVKNPHATLACTVDFYNLEDDDPVDRYLVGGMSIAATLGGCRPLQSFFMGVACQIEATYPSAVAGDTVLTYTIRRG